VAGSVTGWARASAMLANFESLAEGAKLASKELCG
jgi:hypothetical protein